MPEGWRTTQTVVALSNGDAETVAVMGAIESLCFMAGGADVGQWNHGSVRVSGRFATSTWHNCGYKFCSRREKSSWG